MVRKLTGADPGPRARGVAIIVDFVLDQPLTTYLEPARLAAWVAEAITAPNAARVVAEHARPIWKRHLARSKKSRVKASALVSAEARRALDQVLAKHPGPRAAWAEKAVDPRLVAQLLGPVFEELLLAFARRLPFLGGAAADFVGGGGGRKAGIGGLLRATVEKRAGQLVEASRVVLGGFGLDIEQQIRAAAADLGQAATDELRGAFAARVESPEGKAIVAQIRAKALDHVLATSLLELSETVEPIPWEQVTRLVSAVAEHAHARPGFGTLVRDELQALLAALGSKKVRELLDEAGLLETLRADLLAQGDPIAKKLFASVPFREWLAELTSLASA